jgi:hypothetical protein
MSTAPRDHSDVSLDCAILKIEPPRRLVHGFRMVYDPDLAAERPSRVTFDGDWTRPRAADDLSRCSDSPAATRGSS